MPSLSEAVAGLVEDGGAYHTDPPAGWSQGRTLFGGITAALALGSLRRVAPELPALRSAQVAFVGPAAGRLSFRPAILRQGRSATVAAVDCEGEAGLAVRVTFVFGADRESRVAHDLAPAAPVVPPPDVCEPIFAEGGFRPGFAGNFEHRLAGGGRPFSGGDPAYLVWARLRDEAGVDPETALLALGDSLPPAAIIQFPAPAPLSTMTWALDFQQPLAGGGWRLLRSASERTTAGYSLQDMTIWDDAGRRVAAGRQMVAIFA